MMNLMMIKTLFFAKLKKKNEEPSGSGPHVAKYTRYRDNNGQRGQRFQRFFSNALRVQETHLRLVAFCLYCRRRIRCLPSPPLWIFLSPHSLSQTRFLHNIQNNSKHNFFFLKKKTKYPSVVDFKQNQRQRLVANLRC